MGGAHAPKSDETQRVHLRNCPCDRAKTLSLASKTYWKRTSSHESFARHGLPTDCKSSEPKRSVCVQRTTLLPNVAMVVLKISCYPKARSACDDLTTRIG